MLPGGNAGGIYHSSPNEGLDVGDCPRLRCAEPSSFRDINVTDIARRMMALLALIVLAACSAPTERIGAPTVTRGYEGMQDGEYFIQPVLARHLAGGQARTEVRYAGDEEPGSIVVDTFSRKLYFILDGGRAIRYGIAVGREGISFRGSGVIGRMEEWPSWQPTANMVRTRPDLYAEFAGGLPGGLENPLGARAMYLYRNGRDSKFRIHGTIQNESIGHATSAGCIRLFNQDAIDLYNRISIGARVKVRSLEESIAIEGPYMDDAYGRAVPATAANVSRLQIDAAVIIETEAREVEQAAIAAAKAAKDAARADKKRLAACSRNGVDKWKCPPAPADADISLG